MLDGAITADSSGNVGIGTNSPAVKLEVNGGIQTKSGAYGLEAGLYLNNDANANSRRWKISNDWNAFGDFVILQSSTQTGNPATARMLIDPSGNLLVGTTSAVYTVRNSVLSNGANPAAEFRVQSDALSTPSVYFVKNDTSTSTSNVFCRFVLGQGGAASGQINANGASAAAFGTWSDQRLKTNINNLEAQLDNICSLRPVEFDYIESEGGGHQIGFIAQEMQEVYPDTVGEREDGMLTITGWDKTTARLVKAIQEQQAIINDLKARIETLENK